MSKLEELKESKSEKEETGAKIDEIDLTGDGGVIKRIVAPGFGDLSPEDGNDVSIAYTGRFLESGEIFEWREDKDSIVFRLGQNEVCPGLERAIVTMKKREVAEIKIQPKYGYGTEGQPPSIPGNAALVYQVRLLDWNNEVDISEAQDGGIIKCIISCGEGWDKPIEDVRVKVSVQGSTEDDEVFENKEIEFITEEESIKKAGVLPSLMRGILTMKLNEVAMFTIKSKYGYGKEGDNTRNIMPNENLIYKVKLLEFEQEDKEYKKLNSHEKLILATEKKDYGNNLYNNYIMDRAIRKYSISLKILNSIYITDNEEDKQAIKKLKINCHLNIAACYLKIDKENEAVQECSAALKIEPDNLKALFRRGRARMEIKDWENAEKDFKKALEIDSENQEIKNELIRLDVKRKEQEKKDRSIFGGMFKRGQLYEDKTVAHLSFWNRFTSTIFSPGITQEQITVMNFVFIALFVVTIITIILSKPSIHLFVLLGLALFLFFVINWFIANALPEKEKSEKDEKTD